MARIKYREWAPKTDTQERILQINNILAQYQGAVSVRQLYYRLVAALIVPNNDKEYDKVQALLTTARYAGLIDWNAIEDRNREPIMPQQWESGRDLLAGAANSFRKNRWENQHCYLELWVEKAALAGILAPICADYHITLMVNRGYSSASAMKESAERVIRRSKPSKSMPHGHRPTILYIGDHDPSGEDMVRDVRDRLLEFGCPSWLDVNKIALTKAQIEQYDPPPNPAKLTDVRAAKYIDEHGEFSWEVDALPPPVLDLLVRQHITAYIDKKAMEQAITQENIIKNKIKQLAASFQD